MKTHKQLSCIVRFSVALVATIAVVLLYSKIGQTSQNTQQQAIVRTSPQDHLIDWMVVNGGTVRPHRLMGHSKEQVIHLSCRASLLLMLNLKRLQ